LENHDRLLNESIDFWDYSMLIHIKAKYILDDFSLGLLTTQPVDIHLIYASRPERLNFLSI
jgi:hypothetical protein